MAKKHNPDKIIIITDLECDNCFTETKKRLGNCDICITIIAKKSFEAWFLADDSLLSTLTEHQYTHYEKPEETSMMPFEIIKDMLLKYTHRGPGTKVRFAKKVTKLGFDIEQAAKHKHCPSAQYFINKINDLGKN